MDYEAEDTIAAIATPPGVGGVGIIRISGPHALEVANRLVRAQVHSLETHKAHYTAILEGEGVQIDSGLVLPMRSPHSFTGEDVVEIHCHGGVLNTRRVLQSALDAGARPAGPGEFSYRAYRNRKMDLTQAEAICDLIHARSERALFAASQQIQGKLAEKIGEIESQLTHQAAILEAWVDYPEEGLEFTSPEEMERTLQEVLSLLDKLLSTYHDGRLIHEGVAVALVGSPNVGKSSLMNALLDQERAIVSHIPGTTRDTVEESMQLNGLLVRLIDTAGIRKAGESIEAEGIRRSHQAIERADLILLVLDVTRPLNEEEYALLTTLPQEKSVAIWNKVDLPHSLIPALKWPHAVSISAKQQKNLDEVKSHIDQILWTKGPPDQDQLLITSLRHKRALEEAQKHLQETLGGLRANASPELIVEDLRASLRCLARITGADVTENVLGEVFATFCVGK